MTHEQLNYQFLLLTHIVCADQQIHSEEAKALRELGQVARVNERTLQEMENILAQQSNHFSVEAIANRIPHGMQAETMRQLLAIAHVDGYLAPLERKLIDDICEIWHWSTQEIDDLLEEAKKIKYKQLFGRNNDEQTELSFAASLLKNEKKSPLSRAIIDFSVKIAPNSIGRTIKKLEREILLAGPEYEQAIEQCAKIANEDYSFAISTLQKSEYALRELGKNIENILEEVQKKSNYQSKANTAQQVAKQLEHSQDYLMAKIIKELEVMGESINAKHRALNHFSISFMGKTKAGKSTLHAVITGEGWDAIGVGKQRTTRFNRVYEWRNIRIIDTPGIGAPGGKTDEEIAKSIIDESDVICYVVTNDSIQETEFQFMKLLKEKAKPLIILLNIKYNLRDQKRLEHFLKNPDKHFAIEGNDSLQGHFNRIHRYAQEHYANDYFSIIPVMLLAAQMSRELEQEAIRNKLLEVSKLQDFLDSIRESLIKYGAIRRSQNLLGSTVFAIDEPNKWIKEEAQIYEELKEKLKNQRNILQKKIKTAKDDHFQRLKSQIENIFLSVSNSIPTFAEENWNQDENILNQQWKQNLRKINYEDKIKSVYEEAGRNFNVDVQDAIEEIGKELQLIAQLNDTSSFSFQKQDSNTWVRKILQFSGIGIVAIGSAVTLFAGAATLGAPIVLLGTFLGVISGLFKSEKQKRKEAAEKIRSALEEQLKDNREKVIHNSQIDFDKHCDLVASNINQYFDDLLQGLTLINNYLKSTCNNLKSSSNYLNRAYAKRILDWAVDRYEPLTESGIIGDIAKVDRDFGKTMEIKINKQVEINKSPSEFKEILQEDVFFKH